MQEEGVKNILEDKNLSQGKEIIEDVLEELRKVIKDLEEINELRNFKGDLKKLRSGKNFWRMRIGNCRIGLEIENNTLIFVRILHRKEIIMRAFSQKMGSKHFGGNINKMLIRGGYNGNRPINTAR